MKKIALIGLLFIASPAFAAGSINQSSIYDGHYQWSRTTGNERAYFYGATGNGDVNTYGVASALGALSGDIDFTVKGYGIYTVVFSSNSDGYCTSHTLAQCHADILSNGFTYTDYSVTYVVTPPPPGFDALLQEGETAYASTTGESIAAGVGFVGDNFTLLFLGSGLALIYSLRWWIVALIIIGAVVYFAFRAFRFFKH